MKMKYKTIAIIDFICAAGWIICLVFDIVDKSFSIQFYAHIVLAIVSFINAFFFFKKKPDSQKDN